MRGPCSIDGCEAPTVGRGWCNRHYLRWSKYGDPTAGGPTPADPIDHGDGTRTCRTCAERKPLEDFGRDRAATLGRRAACKPCRSQQSSAWYAANQARQLERHRERKARDLDRVRAQDRERYYRHKPKRMALVLEAGRRRRALLAQVDYDEGITVETLCERDGDQCCYCRVTLDFTPGDGRTYVPTKASIEHYVPLTSGGHHTWDNVGLACLQCNVRKQARPLDVWLEVAAHAIDQDQDHHRARARLGA